MSIITRLGLLFCLAAIVSNGSYASQKVYQWRDKSGELHFSDVPHEGAKTIEIQEPQTYQAPTYSNTSETSDESKNPQKQKAIGKTISVVSPRNQSTIRNGTGELMVNLEVSPKLTKGETVQLLFDSKSNIPPQKVLTFKLKNVYRGSHTLSANVLDKSGKVIASSDTITIYMQRPIVHQNQIKNPITPRPPVSLPQP